jgi:hypothetical protein
MLIHNLVITGSLSLNGTDVTGITGSNDVSSSFSALSGSFVAVSSSFVAVSSSYSAASGSLSTRVTTIESKYATTGSNIFTQNQTICGNLTTTGTITAQTINVQQVTSSIVYSSGSNIFGCSLANTQQFTGSVLITGSLTVTTTNAPELTVCATGLTMGNAITDTHQVTGSMFITGSNFRASVTNTCFSGQLCSNTLSTAGTANLGGALTGTTGTFNSSGNILTLTTSGTTVNGQLKVNNSTCGDIYAGVAACDGTSVFTGTTAYSGYIGTNTNTPFYLVTGGTTRVTISSTGAATFACSVTAGGMVCISSNSNSSTAPNIQFTDTYVSAGRNWAIVNGYDAYGTLSFKVSTAIGGSPIPGTSVLSIAQSGAACFSSNVAALSLTVNTADQYLQMNGYNGATTQFISNAGYSSAYNGLQITSNSNNANSLSAWSIDLGGYNSNFSNNDQFNLGRKASGGSWIKFLTITNTGAATFCSSVSLTSGALSVDGFSTPSNNYITLRSGFSPSASGGIGFMAIDHSGTSADGLALYGHDGMSFYTAQTERMRITAAGIACFACQVCAPQIYLNKLWLSCSTGLQQISAARLFTANTTTYYDTGIGQGGMLVVNSTVDRAAVFVVSAPGAGNSAISEIGDPSSCYSTSCNNANTVNFFFSGGNGNLLLQNCSGTTRDFSLTLIGTP